MSYKKNYISVIMPSAGIGKRMQSDISKQYIEMDGKPILAHTIDRFNRCKYIDEIILVVKEDDVDYCINEIVEKYEFSKVKEIVVGGTERYNSVYNGLCEVNKKCDIVLIHDGVRPFIDEKNIVDGIENVIKFGACAIGVPVKDTIKVVNESGDIVDTPNRSRLWAVQTPQCFRYDIIYKAHNEYNENYGNITDDSMLVEKLGHKVKMIKGSYNNIKITTPEDLEFAKVILNQNK